MNSHIVKILENEFLNHSVKRFVVEKPKGFEFIPGQATDVSINKPEWKEQLHPFTFTSLNEWPHLEFTIKIYDEMEGVTHQLGKTNAGEELILHEVFGVIKYKSPGVFIAGGAGVTPFISILRWLQKEHKLAGNSLIFSNSTPEDVFNDKEFSEMLESNYIKVFTSQKGISLIEQRIDRRFLMEKVKDFSQHFYVCGPEDFVSDINGLLADLGAKSDAIVFEK